MVYGRTLGERTIELEASGGLMGASLVMRDRQTDSWWSIMTNDAIAGPLAGTRLPELPVGEKATWADWKRRHPNTQVLSVDGAEHAERNPYEHYFGSDETFRDMAVTDRRLPAKEPVYSFWLDGRPWAAAHSAFAGGAFFDVGRPGTELLLYRTEGASLFESTRAWLVADSLAAGADAGPLAAKITAGEAAGEALGGFDTFWYTWVSINRESQLLE